MPSQSDQPHKPPGSPNGTRGQFDHYPLTQRAVVVPTRSDDDDDVGISLAQVALWAGTGADEEPLDSQYDISDIDEESLYAEVGKVQKFWAEATKLGLTGWCDKDSFTHHFWLDRNGHGTGFWDSCPDEAMGEQLSEMAKAYGPCDLLEGDDGTLSFYPN